MSKLGQVVEAVENYNQFVLDEVKRARTDETFGQQMVDRWNEVKAKTPIGTAPTGLKLPRLALPEIDEAGRDHPLLVRRRSCRASSPSPTARIAKCIWSRCASRKSGSLGKGRK